jgi:hypothetical protein
MTAINPRTLAIVAAIGFLGCAIGLMIDPKTALASYLTAWYALSAIPIGAIAVLFTSYLVRAGWTRELHKPLTAAALTMPIVALLFIPVIFGLGEIYPWVSDASALPAFKAMYLTPWFFILRAAIYLAIWTALAVWSARSYGNDAAMVRAATAGLIVWALTSSWSGIDWIESVEPHFHSSIYGLFAIDFQLLAGLSFGVAAVLILRPARQMSNTAYSATFLSVLLLWAYMHAMQYIIIWSGNIPDEVVWYLKRLDGGWAIALWALYIMQFFVPFFALLSERVRSSNSWLLSLAAVTLALRVLESAVFILPPLGISPFALILCLPAALLANGAILLLAWGFALPTWERWSGRAAPAGHHQHP